MPGLTGSAHPNISPYDKFHTATTEIFVGAGNNRAFARLCAEIGSPELAEDRRFRDNGDRVVNREALKVEIDARLAEVDGHELCARLLGAGLPAGPLMDTAETMEHPHTAHRDMAIAIGGYRGAGTPIKLSRTPGELRRSPPAFAEHGREILREHGFTDAEIEALAAAGALVEERRR